MAVTTYTKQKRNKRKVKKKSEVVGMPRVEHRT